MPSSCLQRSDWKCIDYLFTTLCPLLVFTAIRWALLAALDVINLVVLLGLVVAKMLE